MSLVQIHASLSTAVMLYNGLIGLWGLLKYLRKQEGIDSSYWGSIAISPILGLVQVAVGLTLIAMGLGAGVRLVHYLYGALVVIAIPATFAFTRGRDDRGALLIYALALLLTAVFGARASVTPFSGGT